MAIELMLLPVRLLMGHRTIIGQLAVRALGRALRRAQSTLLLVVHHLGRQFVGDRSHFSLSYYNQLRSTCWTNSFNTNTE